MLTAFSSHRPAVFLCLLLLSYCSSTCADWFNASEDIMGTRISVELWQQDPQLAEQAMAEVMTLMQGVNATMSPYLESSELFQLNQQAAQQPVKVSAELFSLLQKAQYFSIISDGAFDISYASVGRFYNYLSGHAASNADLEKNLSAIDYRLIKLDAEDRSVYFQHPQLAIDLGGIAKGYAVDLAIAALRKRSIASAIVSAGGDSRILGDRQGHPWVMGIRHPRQPDEYAVKLPLTNSAISTSGDYERFFLNGEQRVHHIINPATGRSVGAVQSVSILAALALDSDALSTTVFVLGVKKGLALVNRLPTIEAVIIDRQGRLHYSEGLLRAER